MAVRCASKAIILRNGKVLLNRCRTEAGEVYYDLPGGGQKAYEPMEETVVREVAEETGYRVRVTGFLGLIEQIHEDPALRETWPDYAHRINHIFRAEVIGAPQAPTEKDFEYEGSLWVPLAEADTLPFRPASLSGKLAALLEGRAGPWLGTERVS